MPTKAELIAELKDANALIEKAGLLVEPTYIDEIEELETEALLKIEGIVSDLEEITGRNFKNPDTDTGVAKEILDIVNRLGSGKRSLTGSIEHLTVVVKSTKYHFNTPDEFINWAGKIIRSKW